MGTDKCMYCQEKEIEMPKSQCCRLCYRRQSYKGTLKTVGRGRSKMTHEEWKESLVGRYGIEMVDDLLSLRKNPYTTLQWVGSKHGLSRERVRQIYNKYFNENYRVALKKLSKLRRSDLSCKSDPRNKVLIYKKDTIIYQSAEIEKSFVDLCMSLGFEVSPSCKVSSDIIINGHKVEIKTANKTYIQPKCVTEYYHYTATKQQITVNDFFALHRPDVGMFYIIPNTYKTKKSKSFYIKLYPFSKDNKRPDRWLQYLNRFDLLSADSKAA